MSKISKIDGKLFEKLIINGALNLKANVKEVNELNVFPIPDGDTGDNMFMTINGGVESLKHVEENSVSLKAQALANGMMLNARGNSGVILSQLFCGLAKGLAGLEEATVNDMCVAFEEATKKAYFSVSKPVEGTILTVAREACEYVCCRKDNYLTINDLMKEYSIEMEKSLDRTPELLETLKEAGVIDSGGAGLLYIIKGFNDVLDGKVIKEELTENKTDFGKTTVDFSRFTEDSVMKYGYCTEFLLQLQKCKIDIDSFDIKDIIDYLKTIGDSIVAYLTGTVVKVHVHTLAPYKALEFCQQYGEFLTVKIENMTLQHNEVVANEAKKSKKPRKKYGVVAVATGPGLINTLLEMGVDEVIDGGQGKNPSTKRFIEAFDNVNADYIYVLPNNSNIILTANEAKELYKNSSIFVINTKNFGDAYSALTFLDYEIEDPELLAKELNKATSNVLTGMITKAIREANINHVEIHEGEYIGFSDKTMYTSKNNKIEAYFELLEKLGAKDKQFLINVYGEGLQEQEKIEIEKKLKEKYPHFEVYSIDGGQEIYDLIVILE